MTTQLLLCTGKNYCQKKKLYNELIGLISGSQAQLMRVKRIKKKRKPRKYWVRPGRTSLWWDNMRRGETVDEEWKENLRMSKPSFLKLCDELHPFIVRQTTIM
uniref:Uncharacterized protein n=1 Tax=Amphimedon queenslandica TaxID=400682 RepID=A0A1X7VT90_AMPQE